MLAQDKTNLSGQQIGNYQVEELLHTGKGSTLYRAEDTKLNESVFLLVMQTSTSDDPELAAQFERRMEALGQLKHANIATVADIGVTKDDYPYAVIEYVDGGTLADQIAHNESQGILLSAEEALHIGRQLASALSVAHPAGLIHHDLRPENIYMRDEKTPVLIDLGIPSIASRPEAVLNGTQTAMLDYASPEELEGKALSRRSNIYSLGIMLYELLTNHRPELPASSWDIFERSTMPKEVPLEEAREGLSGETYRLVRNCLWRQEWSRFETADEVITAIDTAVLAEQAPAKKTGILTPTRRPSWVYAAIPVALILFGLLGYAIYSSVFGGGTPTPTPPVPTPTTSAEIPVAGVGDDAEPTATLEAPPTARSTIRISLISPPEDTTDIKPGDPIDFSWLWTQELDENREFLLLLGNEALLIDDAEEDAGLQLEVFARTKEDNYTLAGEDNILEPGYYLWQVRLVDTVSSRVYAESNPRRFIILPTTPTPTSTATPTPTATPDEDECVISPLPGWTLHTVQSGESISGFSQRANVTVETILNVNCLTPEEGSNLSVGQRLYIPPPLATDTPTPSPATSTPTPGGPPSDGGGSGGGNSGGGGGDNPGPEPTSPPQARPTSTPFLPPSG